MNSQETQNNKLDRSEYFKDYRVKNHDKMQENNRKYYENNKNRIRLCTVCNCEIKGINITQHHRTKKHINNSCNNNDSPNGGIN